MPTHKILCDLDVGGEVKGTSLDINGNADIAGNLTLQSGGPNLTLKDTTDNDDQQIHFINSSGGVDYRVHTADFTGGGGGDGLYIGSTGANEVALVANDNTTLVVRSDGQTDEAAVTIVGGGGTNATNIALLLAGDTNGEALKLKIQNQHDSGTLTGACILSYEPDADTFNIGQSTTLNNMAMSIDNSENVTFAANIGVGGTVLGTSAKCGRDSHNLIDFTTDNQIDFRVSNSDQVKLSDTALFPVSNSGSALGGGSNRWAVLFFVSGAFINFIISRYGVPGFTMTKLAPSLISKAISLMDSELFLKSIW